MKPATEYWLESARSDLRIIELIRSEADLTHQVAFHCQQAIEKTLKAIIEQYRLPFVKTHSLVTLFGSISKVYSIDYDEDTIMILDQMYIDARYPGDMGLLPDGNPTIEQASEFIETALSIYNEISLHLLDCK
ncbi:MAG: HEPN domain-containing protein [Candidatus Kapaibacterium sp.]